MVTLTTSIHRAWNPRLNGSGHALHENCYGRSPSSPSSFLPYGVSFTPFFSQISFNSIISNLVLRTYLRL